MDGRRGSVLQLPEFFFGPKPNPIEIAGDVAVVLSPIMHNYFHFLTELVPK